MIVRDEVVVGAIATFRQLLERDWERKRRVSDQIGQGLPLLETNPNPSFLIGAKLRKIPKISENFDSSAYPPSTEC